MRRLFHRVARSKLALCTRGASAVEYAFIISLIVLAMIAALTEVANKTIGKWDFVRNEVDAN